MPANTITAQEKALSGFNWEDVLKVIDAKWHDEFRKYATTGEACDEFLHYIESDPNCEVALDAVLDFMTQGFSQKPAVATNPASVIR